MNDEKSSGSGWKNPKKVKIMIGLAAVALALFGFFFSGGQGYTKSQDNGQKAGKDAAKGPAHVETAKPVFKTLTDSLNSVGTLISNESVTLASETAGKVTGIYFREGQGVKAGQTLIRLDDAVLKATLDSAVADRDLALSKYKRAEELVKVNGVSQQDRDTAYAVWQRDEAAVRLARAQLDKTNIKSPFTGTAGLRQVSPGSYLQAGTAIVNIEDTSRLKIQFNIPQTDASKITPSQSFSITTDEYPGKTFYGKIYAINPKIDETSRSLVVRGIIDNSKRQLKPGLFVQVSLDTGSPEKVMFIPEDAVNPTANGKNVYLLENGTAVQTRIKTGRRITGFVEVTKGLKPGDTVITKGQVRDGDQVIADKPNK